ncbi:uncharacterized protein LOC135129673 isoform X2 [Zophobas morio]|uniref:uncharacterized protein LOC135129673 isoform X2 n=1 Tax=Zophobas morio TaxID=2755281 RepID=UPI003082A90E
MAQIMEFLLNLLLLRGKFLTTTAAETLHEAIRKCLQFKRKIAIEYNTTQVIMPFENMLEVINYNSSQYTCEGRNLVITTQEEYDLYEKLRNNRNQCQQIQQSTSAPAEDAAAGPSETPSSKIEQMNAIPEWLRQESLKSKKENSEYLFKNVIKLVKLLEKNEVLTGRNQKLEKVKKKLVACTDILSNNAQTPKFSSIINNIIEEEITRCRFRHGESKTSAEINLKAPRVEGIEVALDTSHIKKLQNVYKEKDTKHVKVSKKQEEKQVTKIVKQEDKRLVLVTKPEAPKINVKDDKIKENKSDAKIKLNTPEALRRTKSDSLVHANKPEGIHKLNRNTQTFIEETLMDLENSKKLIQENERHFNRFEKALWHSLTTVKFMALKDEHMNMCKCAFYNKRHFIATENDILKKFKQEAESENFNKFKEINNKMFQMVERKLMFESVREELNNSGHFLPPEENGIPLSGGDKKSKTQKHVTKTEIVKSQKAEDQHAIKELTTERNQFQNIVKENIAVKSPKPEDIVSEDNPFMKLREELPQNNLELRNQVNVKTHFQQIGFPQKSQTKLQLQHSESKRTKEDKIGEKPTDTTKNSGTILQKKYSSTVMSGDNKHPSCSEDIAIPIESLQKIRNEQETNTIINSFKSIKSKDANLSATQDENISKTTKKNETDNTPIARKSSEEYKTSNTKDEKYVGFNINPMDKDSVNIIRSNSEPTYNNVKIQRVISFSRIKKLRYPLKMAEVDRLRSIDRNEVLEQKHSEMFPKSSQKTRSRKKKLYLNQLLKKGNVVKKKQCVEEKPTRVHSSPSLLKGASVPVTQKIELSQNLPEKLASEEKQLSDNVNIKENAEEKPLDNPLQLNTKIISNVENININVEKNAETLPLLCEEETLKTQNLSERTILKNEEAKENLEEKFSEHSLEKLTLQQNLPNSITIPTDVCGNEKLPDDLLGNASRAPKPERHLVQSESLDKEQIPEQKQIVDNRGLDKKTIITQKLILPQNMLENKGLKNLEKKIADLCATSQEKKFVMPELHTMPSRKIPAAVTTPFKSELRPKYAKEQRKAPTTKSAVRGEVMKTQFPKHHALTPQAVSASVASVNKQKLWNNQNFTNATRLVPDKPQKRPPNWKVTMETVSSVGEMNNFADIPNFQSHQEKVSPRSAASTSAKAQKVSHEKRVEIVEKYSQRTSPQPLPNFKSLDNNVVQKKKTTRKSPEIFVSIKENTFANIKRDILMQVNAKKFNKTKTDEKILANAPSQQITVQKGNKKQQESHKEVLPNVPSQQITIQKGGKKEQESHSVLKFSSQKTAAQKEKISQKSKLKTADTKMGKLLTPSGDAQKKKEEKKPMYTVEPKSETDKAKKEKMFKELEATIRSVKIFVDNTPKRPTRFSKATNERNKRKLNEPVSKCMSTKQLATILKQQSGSSKIKQEIKYSNTSEQISNDIILSKHRPFKESRKPTSKYSLPSEKTFLKKSKNIHTQEKENKESQTKIAENCRPNVQMLRTTKNAMKRQQASVMTPKLSKNNEDKKKSQTNVPAVKDTYVPKSGQKKQPVEKKGLVTDHVTKTETHVGAIARTVTPRSAFNSSIVNKNVNKAPCGKIYCVKWKTEKVTETLDTPKT